MASVGLGSHLIYSQGPGVPVFICKIMDAQFIKFCQNYLGDAGVYDSFNQQFLLKKTQNYYHAWCRAKDSVAMYNSKQSFVDAILPEVNDTYEIGERWVTIDRRRHYELIYEYWKH